MPNLVKKRSIRRQMSTTMLAISLLVILILGIVTFTSLFQMRTHTLKINGEMGTQAAADSRAILENEALDQLAAIAASTAGTVDANIQSIMSQVDILAASAEKLYASPESFGRIEVLPPNADNQGLYVAQIVYAERTSPEEVADEVGLMGNLTIQMNATSQFLAGAGTTQLGTESGFIVMCDENSSLKTSMGYLDPVERSWYRSAADSGQLVWSDAFEDTYGRGLAVTCGTASPSTVRTEKSVRSSPSAPRWMTSAPQSRSSPLERPDTPLWWIAADRSLCPGIWPWTATAMWWAPETCWRRRTRNFVWWQKPSPPASGASPRWNMMEFPSISPTSPCSICPGPLSLWSA